MHKIWGKSKEKSPLSIVTLEREKKIALFATPCQLASLLLRSLRKAKFGQDKQGSQIDDRDSFHLALRQNLSSSSSKNVRPRVTLLSKLLSSSIHKYSFWRIHSCFEARLQISFARKNKNTFSFSHFIINCVFEMTLKYRFNFHSNTGQLTYDSSSVSYSM